MRRPAMAKAKAKSAARPKAVAKAKAVPRGEPMQLPRLHQNPVEAYNQRIMFDALEDMPGVRSLAVVCLSTELVSPVTVFDLVSRRRLDVVVEDAETMAFLYPFDRTAPCHYVLNVLLTDQLPVVNICMGITDLGTIDDREFQSLLGRRVQ